VRIGKPPILVSAELGSFPILAFSGVGIVHNPTFGIDPHGGSFRQVVGRPRHHAIGMWHAGVASGREALKVAIMVSSSSP